MYGLMTTDAFHELLETVGRSAAGLEEADSDTLTTVEGCHWLIEFTGTLLEMFIHRDRARPRVMSLTTPFRRFLGDHCLGAYNYVAELDPACEYHLSCRPGDAVFHSVTLQGGPGLPLSTAARVLGKLNHTELDYEADGTFVVALGGKSWRHNWIPLGDGPAGLLTREFFCAPLGERTEARRRIENLTEVAPHRPVDERLADGLRAVRRTLEDAAARYPLPVGRAVFAQGGLNNFAELTRLSESNTPTWGNLDAFHTTMAYELEPDEALVIEGGPVVPCSRWAITQNNRYLASFAIDEPVALPGNRVAVDADGTWRAVLSERDVGAANRLSTAGHRHGIVRIRWLIAEQMPDRPATKKMKLGERAARRTQAG